MTNEAIKKDIRLVRLTSTELLIGLKTRETAEKIFLEDAFLVFTQPDKYNNATIQFAPYNPLSMEFITGIAKSSIQFDEVANAEMQRNYLKATSSVILPEAQQLILG